MENESNIALGGTIILLTLNVQKYIFRQRYEKGTKQMQNRPIETNKCHQFLQGFILGLPTAEKSATYLSNTLLEFVIPIKYLDNI